MMNIILKEDENYLTSDLASVTSNTNIQQSDPRKYALPNELNRSQPAVSLLRSKKLDGSVKIYAYQI